VNRQRPRTGQRNINLNTKQNLKQVNSTNWRGGKIERKPERSGKKKKVQKFQGGGGVCDMPHKKTKKKKKRGETRGVSASRGGTPGARKVSKKK